MSSFPHLFEHWHCIVKKAKFIDIGTVFLYSASMKLESIAIDDIHLDPANVRTHGKKNADALIGSLTRFGQQKPIVINESNIVLAGNGTFQAAKSLGWTHIECVRTELGDMEAVAYAIADNRTAELAEWDKDGLAMVLDQLPDDILLATGFDEKEIAEMVGEMEEKAISEPAVFEPDYLVLISCTDEAEQKRAYKVAKESGFSAKVLD